MSSIQPPSPPSDSEEVSDYVIKDKVYYLLYGAAYHTCFMFDLVAYFVNRRQMEDWSGKRP